MLSKIMKRRLTSFLLFGPQINAAIFRPWNLQTTKLKTSKKIKSFRFFLKILLLRTCKRRPPVLTQNTASYRGKKLRGEKMGAYTTRCQNRCHCQKCHQKKKIFCRIEVQITKLSHTFFSNFFSKTSTIDFIVPTWPATIHLPVVCLVASDL